MIFPQTIQFVNLQTTTTHREVAWYIFWRHNFGSQSCNGFSSKGFAKLLTWKESSLKPSTSHIFRGTYIKKIWYLQILYQNLVDWVMM